MTFNVTDDIRAVASLHPGAPAIAWGLPRTGVQTVDYATLDGIVDAIAARLLDRGLAAGASIDLYTHDAVALMFVKLGAGRAGIATFHGARSRGVDLAIVKADRGAPAGPGRLAYDDTWWSRDALARAPRAALPRVGGAIAFTTLRTSGSTGRPKEVSVTHDMMRDRWFCSFEDGIPAGARLLCASGPAGGVGLGLSLRVLSAGGTVVVAERQDDLAAVVDAHRVNAFVGSPSSVTRLMRDRPAGAGSLASLRAVQITGARLPGALARAIRERVCPNLWCSYGATEIGPVAFGPLASMGDRPGATGYVVPRIEVQAVDEAGRALPPGRPGLLRMRGPGMCHAYVEHPEASAQRFHDGWFVPGDIGTVHDDGVLCVEGRNDDLINLGGSKFAPEIFEEILLGVPGVLDAAAFPIHAADGASAVGAAIVASRDVSVQALEAPFRGSQLPMPAIVLRMARLPRTDTGKVLRRELAEMATSRRPAAPA